MHHNKKGIVMSSDAPKTVEDIGEKLSWKARIGYGSFGFAMCMWTMVTMWQLFYYTTFVQIPVVIVTVLLSVGKIVGACAAPVWGFLSDRLYQTKFGRKVGRRRGIMLIAVPLNAICYVLVWLDGMPVWFYFIANMLYWGVYSGITTLQYLFPAEMTEDPNQRQGLVGINQVASAISSIALNTLNTYLFVVWGDKTWDSYFKMAMIYGVVGTVVLFLGFFMLYDRPYDESTSLEDAVKKNHGGLAAIKNVLWNIYSCFRVRSYRVYLAMYACETMYRNLRGTIQTYFVIFVLLLDSATVSIGGGLGFVFGLIFLAFFVWLTSKTNAPFTFRVGSAISFLCFVCFFLLATFKDSFTPGTRAAIFVGLIILYNLGNTGVFNSAQLILTFIPDVDEAVTSKRREGQFASTNSTFDVVFSSLETILVGVVLQATGFVEGSQTQPPSTVTALTILFCFVPLVMICFGVYFSFKLKFDNKSHDILITELTRLREGGKKEDAPAEAVDLIERMSGFKYDQCWGNNNVLDSSKKAA